MFFYIILAVLLLLTAGYFALLEHAFVNCNRFKFEFDIKEGRRYATLLDSLTDNFQEFILVIKFIKNITSVLAVVLLFFIGLDIIVYIFVSLFLYFLFCDALPRVVSIYYSNRILESFSLPALLILKKFIKERRREQSPEEESGEIELFKNALDFRDVTIGECIIPRNEICALDINSSIDQLLNRFIDSGYSRVIIYEGSLDNIKGYVHSKDLYSKPDSIASIIRKIDFFHESKRAADILAEFIKGNRSIGVVLDEYGGTSGIFTIEDLIEEIIGEISDELDKDEIVEKEISDREFIFSGRAEVKYLNREYNLQLPDSDDYETLGGLIIYVNENIPVAGEQVLFAPFLFTILKTKGNRIDIVNVRILEE